MSSPQDTHPDVDGKSMLMSWCHSSVGFAIQPNMGIIKVHNEVPCESHLISEQDVSCKLCVYNTYCKTQWSGGVRTCTHWMLHMSSDHGEFCRQEKHRYSQQLQIFAHCSGTFFHSSQYANIPIGRLNCSKPSSIRHPWSKELRFAYSLVIFGEFFIVDEVLRRSDALPESSHWHGRTWNACLPFPEYSN